MVGAADDLDRRGLLRRQRRLDHAVVDAELSRGCRPVSGYGQRPASAGR